MTKFFLLLSFFIHNWLFGQFDYKVTTTLGDTIPDSIRKLTFFTNVPKVETKKDTVYVDVLFNDGFTLLLQSRRKERTFEYRDVTFPHETQLPDGSYISLVGVANTTKKWILMEQKFIDPVDNCYLLHPLFD